MEIITDSYIERETEETKKAEALLAERVGRYWRAKLKKMDKVYTLDFAIWRAGSVKAWAECKCRPFPYAKYPTYMMSVKKLNACREYSLTTKLKAFWIAGYTDGDYWVDTAVILDRAKEFRKDMGGTEKRGWSRDIETMIYVPIELFNKF